jgi:molecular chaperone GrpE
MVSSSAGLRGYFHHQLNAMTDSVTNQNEVGPLEEEDRTTAEPLDGLGESEELGEGLSEAGGPEDVSIQPDSGPDSGPEAVSEVSDEERDEAYEVLNDRHLRLAAEFNNYRRRVERERVDTWGRAQADLLGRLLDVLDDLQRVAGLDLTNTTVEGIMEGIDLVERKFLRALDDAGAEAIDPEGEPFDPQTMEAVMRVPAESEGDDDTVAQVFHKGYALKGHLVRVARVRVLKHG